MQTHAEQTEKHTNSTSKTVTNPLPSHTSNSDSTLQLVDNRPETVHMKDLQSIANNRSTTNQLLQRKSVRNPYLSRQESVIQQKSGSHGKKKKLNVQGSYTDNGETQNFNDRDEDISIVKGHGGYEDQGALAEQWVRKAYRLSPNAVVTITNYSFYTAK
ncbi:hypothetical protein [Algoriphagus halophilus]|uniref:Uncharacterized protein n=1 Tax=Algoriphagus halophilus TaxID=226505 RepID=A0A1N6D3S4_9BACT|nr:hypothetical protein [Algoriphagus halophilus]SIN65373.1 hypothetical protein SAMN05444394_0127 [Algoriphagus halophilus]